MKFTYLVSGQGVPALVFQWAKRLVDDLNRAQSLIPVGGSQLVIGDVPPDYLEADGSMFDADQYPALAYTLGGNTLPNWTAPSGGTYAIRAR